MIKIVNGRIVVSISIFIETVMMICCENAGNLAGCGMFPDIGYDAMVSFRFIVVVSLLDPLLYWRWWLFTDDENMGVESSWWLRFLCEIRVWIGGMKWMMVMWKVWICLFLFTFSLINTNIVNDFHHDSMSASDKTK